MRSNQPISPPVVVEAEATQSCSQCGTLITRTAKTEEEKKALYEWAATSATCEACVRNTFVDWYDD